MSPTRSFVDRVATTSSTDLEVERSHALLDAAPVYDGPGLEHAQLRAGASLLLF